MSWQAIAERAVRMRSDAILARISAAIAEHAAHADVDVQGNEIRVRGRGLQERWIGEPALRFARRIQR